MTIMLAKQKPRVQPSTQTVSRYLKQTNNCNNVDDDIKHVDCVGTVVIN